MKYLRYKEILFDDYTDQRGTYEKCGDYWVSICPDCLKKYKAVLGDHVTDDGASGFCCVCGCGETENAEYYVDFSADEVAEIKTPAEFNERYEELFKLGVKTRVVAYYLEHSKKHLINIVADHTDNVCYAECEI